MRLSTAVLALSCAPGNDHRLHLVKIVTGTPRLRVCRPPLRFCRRQFTVNRQENYRLNLPTFTAMYARGQQDKAAGMSESDARRTAEAIKQQAAQGTRTEHAFTGNASDKWDNAMENKDAVLFGNELSGAYLDGYLGVK